MLSSSLSGPCLTRTGARSETFGRPLAALAATAVLCAPPAAQAQAAAPRATVVVGQGFSFEDNLNLSPDSPGEVFVSTTAVDGEVSAGDGVFEWLIGAGADLIQAIGAGETPELDSVNPRVSGGFTVRDARTEFRGDAYLRSRPVSAATGEALLDPNAPLVTDPPPPSGGDNLSGDLTSAVARQLDFGAGLNMTLRADATTSLDFGFGARARRFSEQSDANAAELADSETFFAHAGVRRQISPRTEIGINLDASLFDSDGGFTDASRVAALTGEVSTRLTPRHAFDLLAGVAVIDSDFAPRRRNAGRNSDTQIGFVGSAGFTYALSATTIGLTLSQSIEPSSLGELQNQTDLTLGLSHAVNERLRLGFVGAAGLETTFDSNAAGATDRVLFTLAPSVRYEPAKDWLVSVGYRFRFSDQETEPSATSHALFLSVSRSFDGLLFQ